jgi:plastocyanin
MRGVFRHIVLVVVVGCTFGLGAASAAQRVTVSMKNNFFQPAYVEVAPGDTVVWTNAGSVQHSSTSYQGLWDSGLLNPGASFGKVMTVAGSHRYYCIPHEGLGMLGTVNVVAHKRANVSMNDNFFSPAYIQVSLGDTVVWTNAGTVQHSSTSYQSLWNSGLLNPGASYRTVMTASGPHQYYCIPHEGLGMVGAVSVVAHKRVDVQMDDNTMTGQFFFSPANITVAPGDTVRWTNVGHVTHTATSGTAGGSDEGMFFDSGNVSPGGTFRFVMPETSGVINYHCIPHAGLGMLGTITVQQTSVASPAHDLVRWMDVRPVPARGPVAVSFTLVQPAPVSVTVVNAAGAVVARLYDGPMMEGPHTYVWIGRMETGRHVPNGVYYSRVEILGETYAHRIVLLR